MRFFRKGQGATEYLIILAIVIIIALIVAGVLGFIPGLGGTASSRTSETFWSARDVALIDPVKNNRVNAVTLTTVSIDGQNFAAGQTVGAGGSVTLSGAFIACTAGQTVSYAVSIAYTDTTTSGAYTDTGSGNTFDGTCAS